MVRTSLRVQFEYFGDSKRSAEIGGSESSAMSALNSCHLRIVKARCIVERHDADEGEGCGV